MRISKRSKTNERTNGRKKRNMADQQQRRFSRAQFRIGLVKKSDMVARIHVHFTHDFWYIRATFLRILLGTKTEKMPQTPVLLGLQCVFNRTTACVSFFLSSFCLWFLFFCAIWFLLAVDVLVCNSYTISLLPITWQHLKIFLRSSPSPLPLPLLLLLPLLSSSSPSLSISSLFGLPHCNGVLFAALYDFVVRANSGRKIEYYAGK